MKKIISVLAGLVVMVMAVASVTAAPDQKISDWAKESVTAANASGIIPEDQIFGDFTKPISRGDMAELLMNAYEAYTGKTYRLQGSDYFSDVYYNNDINSVYELGIMSGTGEGTFGADGYITREQMAKVLLTFRAVIMGEELIFPVGAVTPFTDFDQVSDWAKVYVSKAYHDGLIGGYDDGRFAGRDDVSWEMALALIMRSAEFEQKAIPRIESLGWDGIIPSGEDCEIAVSGEGEITLYAIRAGQGSYSYAYYLGRSRDGASIKISANTLDSDSMYYIYAVSNGVYSDFVRVFTDKYNIIFDCDTYAEPGSYDIRWVRIPGPEVYKVTVTEQRDSYYSGDIAPKAPISYDIRWENYVTINLNPNRKYKIEISADSYYTTQDVYTSKMWPKNADAVNMNYPQTQAEAEALQVNVTVPVWKINKKGQKYASTASFRVHHLIADEVKLVFEEIFNGPEKFPFKDVGGYAWRGGRSEHNGGTAIDINANENYCVYSNGNVVGSHWKPYEDQYSITPYGDVVNAFEKYGFTWGGDAWASPKDYMHFSYLGT